MRRLHDLCERAEGWNTVSTMVVNFAGSRRGRVIGVVESTH